MKKLVLTLDSPSPLGTLPKRAKYTEFFDGEELLTDTCPETEFRGDGEDAEFGLYFLVASELLARKDPVKSNTLRRDERAKKLQNKLHEVAKRGADAKRKAVWYESIFGENPKGKYVFTRGGKVGFSENWDGKNAIELDIVRDGRKGRALDAEELESYCESLLSEPKVIELIPHNVEIVVTVTRTTGISGPFSNRGEEAFNGYIRKNDVFSVDVTTNYKTSILIIWIDAMGGVFELFPEYSKIIGDGYRSGSEYEPCSGGTWACFPHKDTLTIDTKTGVENCLVFTRPQKFSRDDVGEIKLRLRNLMIDKRYCISSNEFDYCEMLLGETINKMREVGIQMDLEGTPTAKEWRSAIVEQMSGYAKIIHFLQLSHPRPGSC